MIAKACDKTVGVDVADEMAYTWRIYLQPELVRTHRKEKVHYRQINARDHARMIRNGDYQIEDFVFSHIATFEYGACAILNFLRRWQMDHDILTTFTVKKPDGSTDYIVRVRHHALKGEQYGILYYLRTIVDQAIT